MRARYGIWGIAFFAAAIATDGLYRTIRYLAYALGNDVLYPGYYKLAFDPSYGGFWFAASAAILSILTIIQSKLTTWAIWTTVFFGLLLLLSGRLRTGTTFYDPSKPWVLLHSDLLLSSGLVIFGCCAAFYIWLLREADEAYS